MNTTNIGSSAGHGAVERGLISAAQATAGDKPDAAKFEGRFGRMFPNLQGAVFSLNDLEDLARAMSAPADPPTLETELDSEENLGLPAGYTYFGQFVDHDITLDATTLSMRQEDLDGLENFRTPALDLDSLYGRGPADQPYMFDADGRRFALGRNLTDVNGNFVARDLPRFDGNDRALIGDKRNDENVIVSQLHGLFLRFHNKLADRYPNWSFEQIRQQVQWHYQWLVLFDYLPRIVPPDVVKEILPHIVSGKPPRLDPPALKLFDPVKFSFMPVEFSGAAYRFGHSMVRPIYRLNANPLPRFTVFNPQSPDQSLNGFRKFPSVWGIDWKLFFETPGRKLQDHFLGEDRIQPAYKIDTSLVDPLSRLPEFSDGNGDPSPAGAINHLALRNLMRGMSLKIPSGQAVANAIGEPVIPDTELLIGKADADHFDDATAEPITTSGPNPKRRTMRDNAPLWFYVLAEARYEWKRAAASAIAAAPGATDSEKKDIINKTPIRMGRVGGRIIAETLIGLAWQDPGSFLRADHTFVPLFGDPTKPIFEQFTIGDLIG